MAYLGDLSGELSQWQRQTQGGGKPTPTPAGGAYLGDLSGELAAHKKKKVETPRAEPTVTMSPAEQAKAKQLGYDTAPGGPTPAWEDVAGRYISGAANMVEHPIKSAEGFVQSLPVVAGATEGYRVAKEGMSPEEVQQSLHQYELYARKHGASPEDAKIIAKARFNKEMVGHPWNQALEGGLQRETQNDIGLAAGTALGVMGGPATEALGKVGGRALTGALGGTGFQAANEYQTGELQRDPRQAVANTLLTGTVGAGLGAMFPGGKEVPKRPGGPGGPGGPNTIEALAAEGRAENTVPGQPNPASPGPHGGPGEPPANAATPPEDRVLDFPAVKVKKTGKIIKGMPGENHADILKRARLNDKVAVRGFTDNNNKWLSRHAARTAIAKQTGVDVGPGSPTSEQLEAEQGYRPPGQGTPAASQAKPATPGVEPKPVKGTHVVTIRNTVDPSAPGERHLVTDDGLKKLQARYKGDPYSALEVRPADARDVQDARAARTGTQQVGGPYPPDETYGGPVAGQPGNRIGPNMQVRPAPGAPAVAPVGPPKANDFSRAAILKRAENFDFGKGAPKGAAAEGRGPKVTISARDAKSGRFLKRKVAASKVAEHVAGLKQEGFPEVAVSMPGFSDRAIQNKLPNFPEEPAETGLPAEEELGNTDLSSLPQVKPPTAAAPPTRVVDMTPTGGGAALGGAPGMEMRQPVRRAKAPSIDEANRQSMYAAAQKSAREAKQAAMGSPHDPFELMQAAHDAEQRGDHMGAQELRNKAQLALAAKRAGTGAPVPSAAAPQAASAVPEEVQVAQDLEKAVQPPPEAPEPTQTSVPAEAKSGTPAVYDEYAKKVYTPANGKTYEYVRNLVKRNPLKYQEGHLGPGGRFVEGPQKPVEPAAEAAPKPVVETKKSLFKKKLGQLVEANPRGSVVMPEIVTRAGLQARNLKKALAVNFGGSFEDIAERGKHLIRAGTGEGNRLIAQMSHAFDGMRPALETLSHDDRLDWMERADKGLPQATPELQQLADAWHGLNKRMLAQATALARRLNVAPSKLMPAFKEWYFPRVFKNAGDGEAAFSMWQNSRPMAGSKEYFKQRSFPTLADAIDANRKEGRELLSDNPVDILSHTYTEFQKYMSALDTLGQMNDARDANGNRTMRQWVERGAARPQGWVPDPTEFSKLKLGGTPKGKPGEWYVPEPLGLVLRNHLSPGLWRQGWYRTLRYGVNDMNLLQLGFSGFHVMMTGLNSAASDLALAMGKLARGQFTEAAGRTLRSALPGPSMAGFWREGYAAEKAFLNGDMGGNLHPMMQAFFDAGGRLHTDHEYINGHVAAFRDAVRQGRGLGIRNILRAPLAAAELSGRPLFETLIPRVKLGVFLEQAAHELKDLDPHLDRAEYLKRASGILDSVDNRFGMINYDNLFWNKTYQNLIHIFTRAPGWYLGTFREYGGAFRDLVKDRVVSRKMQFALASLATTALWSTLYQYASTGTTPHIDPKDPWTSWRNIMHPLSGRTMADGTPERIQWPSYIKDLEELQHATMDQSGSLKEYAASKASPLVSLVAALGSNADWKNQMIRNPDDPRLKQWYDTLKFIGKDNLLPISIQNAMRRNELQSAGLAPEGKNQQPLIETALGITVPKRRWLETPFRNALYEDRIRHLPRGPYTPEEIQQRSLRNEFASLARRTHDPDRLQQLAEKYYEKGLSINEIKAAAKMGTEDPLEQSLKGASLQAILANYSKASPEEQKETILAIGSKFAKAGSSVGPKQYGKYRDQFMHIMMAYTRLETSEPDTIREYEEKHGSD